ncbi:GlxA family transcriptional regulator [Ningiella sp. W23]|uniref:GlxA family transcriptional regulator n=1 Tax=Ningiella sp. W23 TaxID=3023715 RepID=UPI00375662C4
MKIETPAMIAEPKKRIVFLTFPNVALLDLTGPWEVFSHVNKQTKGASPYVLELVSGNSDRLIDSQGGIALASHLGAEQELGAIHTLVVPAADMSCMSYSTPIIQRLAERAKRIASICGGAFLLAEAGVLDEKRATTHWRGVGELSKRYPSIKVQPDAIFVKDGNVYTSAGVTAGIDLALALVEEDLGKEIALECARDLVVFMRRSGGQSQYSQTLAAQHAERDSINELMAWITDNPAVDLSVEALADRVNMSVRNFSRVFSEETGITPAMFVEQTRIDTVRRHLECTTKSLEHIAMITGYKSADAMRRAFKKVVKVSPSDYRHHFNIK